MLSGCVSGRGECRDGAGIMRKHRQQKLAESTALHDCGQAFKTGRWTGSLANGTKILDRYFVLLKDCASIALL